MARKKLTDQLDDEKKRQGQINARVKELQAKVLKEVRKADDRRKFVAGGLVLEYRKKYPDDPFSIKLNKLIAEHVTRPHDRALFELDPLPEKNTNGQSSQADDTQLANPNAYIPCGDVPNSFDDLSKESAVAT